MKHGLRLLLAVLAASVALVALPSAAGAFNIANFNYTNSSTQASGHPETTISFQRQGGEDEDLKDIQLDLPTGVFANPESANPKCTAAQFNGDTCPANAQVGTVSATVKALGLLDMTIAGTIDVLTPDNDQVATLGVTLRPDAICILLVFCAQPQKIFLKTGVRIKTYEDSGLRTYTPGSPRSAVIGIPLVFVTPTINGDITVNEMSLSFQARSGTPTTTRVCGGFLNMTCNDVTTPPSGPYFWQQTGSCLPATSTVTIVSYQGAQSTASKTFTPTGCPNVPFDPSINWSVANNNAGANTTATFSLSLPDADAPIQNALAKIVDVDFPNGSGIDLNALSGVTACTEDQLKAQACPASSIIGTANAFSKYLPPASGSGPGLAGNVYAMGVGNQIPIGVQLLGPRNTVVIFRGTLGVRGDASLGTGRAYSLFDRIPQLPFKSFSLTLTRPVYKNPDATCGSNTVNAKITGFNGVAPTGNGTIVNRTSNYNVVNCSAVPDTTITNKPPSPTTNSKPAISFTSTIAGSTFQCKYDNEPYQLCSSPFTPSLPLSSDPVNPHTFSVYAVNGLAVDPTPATYSFIVNTGSNYVISLPNGVTVSDTTAAKHPDISTTVNVSGGQPKSFSIKMPAGLNASLAAVPLCSAANAAAGTCAASSKVGTMQLTANTGNGPVTGVGDVFLTEAPTANDAGGIAVKIPLGGVGDFIASGGGFLVNNGNNQNLEIRGFPTIINGTDITVTQLVLSLSGANNFLTNASNCSATDGFVANSTAFDGTLANPVPAAYQSTCSPPPPFAPTLNLNILNPNAGQASGVVANVTVPSGNSTIRLLRTTLPPSLGPNYPGFGAGADQCPSGSAQLPTSVFNPSGCPPQAKVGTMIITTPLLSTPLTGDVFLINKTPIPWMGVKFDQPGISVRVTGVTSLPKVDPSCDEATDPAGFCQTQISVLFNNLPDIPMSGVQLNLNGPARTGSLGPIPGELLSVSGTGDTTCAPGPARSTVIPFAAGSPTANLVQTININGC